MDLLALAAGIIFSIFSFVLLLGIFWQRPLWLKAYWGRGRNGVDMSLLSRFICLLATSILAATAYGSAFYIEWLENVKQGMWFVFPLIAVSNYRDVKRYKAQHNLYAQDVNDE